MNQFYRTIPTNRGRRAEVVAPYGDLCSNTTTANRHGGLYRTTNNDSTFKFRRQVERGRQSGSCRPQQIQRRGHALKTPSAKQKPPPPRPKHRAKPTRRSTEAAPRPMVLRGSKIIELIHRYDIETQEELAEKLNEEGFEVTQATVSRDIRELKLTKLALDNGKQKYIILQNQDVQMNDKYLRVLKEGYLSVDRAENILVVKTVSGMAMAVAAALDAMNWSEIVGCIAGDDTIMAAIRTKEDALIVMDKIRKIVISR